MPDVDLHAAILTVLSELRIITLESTAPGSAERTWSTVS